MPATLWVVLGLMTVAAVVGWLFILRTKKHLISVSSGSSSSGLAGPNWPEQGLVPERFAARQVVEPNGAKLVSGLTKTEAEDLLDWLEAHGIQNRELLQADDQGFAVRYQPEPAVGSAANSYPSRNA